ncbi:MAG: hypothetical protein ACOYVD_08360 [Bacillota bacterium]
MKTVIISNFRVAGDFIKNALSDLQPHTTANSTWYKGKFYTKELYLVELHNNQDCLGEVLDELISEGRINNVISIGLGSPIAGNMRTGDILANDFPRGSNQHLLDLFLNQQDDEEEPLRIFAGNILAKNAADEEVKGLSCFDADCEGLFSLLKNKGLSTLALRVIIPEGDEVNLDSEIRVNVFQKLLLLLKKAVERTS